MGLSFVYDKIIKNPSLAGHIITEMLLLHYKTFFFEGDTYKEQQVNSRVISKS